MLYRMLVATDDHGLLGGRFLCSNSTAIDRTTTTERDDGPADRRPR